MIGEQDSKRGRTEGVKQIILNERGLGVLRPVRTHVSYMGTLRGRKWVALHPESHQKQGAKALRDPQKGQEASSAGLLGDKSSMRSTGRKASWRRKGTGTDP